MGPITEGLHQSFVEMQEEFRNESTAFVASLQNPYPFLAELRQTSPILKTRDHWAVTTYEYCDLIVRDKRGWVNSHVAFATADSFPYLVDPNMGLWSQVFGSMVNFTDGDQHRRLRQMIAPLFTLAGIERFRERVRDEIESQWDEAIAQHGCDIDLKRDFALPMPTRIILDILGVSQSEAYRFYETAGLLMPANLAGTPEEFHSRCDEVIEGHVGYMRSELTDRRTNPSDDWMSVIAGPDKHGDLLSDIEQLAMLNFLIIAGYETTANSFTNGVFLLLEHPDEMEKLRQDRSLIPSAVEEILRCEGAVRSAAPRFAAEDTDFFGHQIKKGDLIWAAISAANRDPEKFSDPDRFDITRDPNPHLAFSTGPHFCLGRPLARMETAIGLEVMLDRIADLTLTGIPRWTANTIIRELESLPVRLTF